jgi:hypothetical protein
MLLIALSMAEICSVYPTAGGLYYWVCRLRPQSTWLGFYTGNVYVCLAQMVYACVTDHIPGLGYGVYGDLRLAFYCPVSGLHT